MLLLKRPILCEEGRYVRFKSPIARQAKTKVRLRRRCIFTICRDPNGHRSPLQEEISGCKKGMLPGTQRRIHSKLAAIGQIHLH